MRPPNRVAPDSTKTFAYRAQPEILGRDDFRAAVGVLQLDDIRQ